jgi:hypothetical protein
LTRTSVVVALLVIVTGGGAWQDSDVVMKLGESIAHDSDAVTVVVSVLVEMTVDALEDGSGGTL